MKKPLSTLIPVVATAMVVAVSLYQSRTSEPTLCEDTFARLGEIAGYESKAMEIDKVTKDVLPKDTILERRLYTAKDGSWAVVSLVIGGKSKSSIHRPELCLPSNGLSMSDPRTIEVDDIEWRKLTLEGKDGKRASFAYTFYNQTGYRTSSHLKRIFRDVWDRSIYGRIDRWAMLTVVSSQSGTHALKRFLENLKGMPK